MSADPEEEDVLLAEFEQVLDTPPLRPALDEMVKMDVEADLLEIQKPIPPSPIAQAELESLFTQSQILKQQGTTFQALESGLWAIQHQGQRYTLTFDPELYSNPPELSDAHPLPIRLLPWVSPCWTIC